MNLNFNPIFNNEKDINNNNLLLKDKNELSEIGLSEMQNDENTLFDYNNNYKDVKNNIDNSNYLINSNISNNLKVSHNSYLRNLNNNKATDNREFMKDNSLANLLFSNDNNNNNSKENEKTNNKNKQNIINDSLLKNKLA